MHCEPRMRVVQLRAHEKAKSISVHGRRMKAVLIISHEYEQVTTFHLHRLAALKFCLVKSFTQVRAPLPGLTFRMLDAFEILTTSGIVLWRKHYAPVSSNVINSLINDVFIEERGQKNVDSGSNAPYKKDKYTLRWTSAKDIGVIFVGGKSRFSNSFNGEWSVDSRPGCLPELTTSELG